MRPLRSVRLGSRRGFTIQELLVAMALIVFVMVILSEAFAAGVDSFRQLKAIGDMQEKLRAAAAPLRRDLAETHFRAAEFITNGLRTGSVDPKEAADLHARYEKIAADAAALREFYREVELSVVNPPAKRALGRVQETLVQIQRQADNMVALIRLVEDD
jgi:prepilin-type N-terminal cleavage/methylation domain-containing protein